MKQIVPTALEAYFAQFRNQIIGINATFTSSYGEQKILYADWVASGRLYRPIEEALVRDFGPMVGNTHSEESETGTVMTRAYHLAHAIIKQHVNAGADDVIITAATGMTGVVCKLQRILGLKIPENLQSRVNLPESERPVVFISHLEHHSNHTSWLETIADVVVLEPDRDLLVDPDSLRREILKYGNRVTKLGAFSACSNVTGYRPPIHELARVMHEHGGLCLVDYAASAPYVRIDMHPVDPMAQLDGVYFSPHKFLGGPGSTGVVVFNRKLYVNRIPDHPGGGTVNWTNRWNEHSYVSDVEAREDGGTPGFMQAFRCALSIRLKEAMGVEHMAAREKELLAIAFEGLSTIPGVRILADNVRDRLGVISLYIEGVHHNLATRLLNDRYGIQVRGGCSCAGTYGHFLLNVDYDRSREITDRIDHGDLSMKPGWIRVSLHPTMTTRELHQVIDALRDIAKNYEAWSREYRYCGSTNEFHHISENLGRTEKMLESWFSLPRENELDGA